MSDQDSPGVAEGADARQAGTDAGGANVDGAGANGPDANGKRSSQSDFITGAVMGIISLAMLVESIRMPYYEEGKRGLLSSPGLTPGLLAAGLLIMSLLLMFRARGFTVNLTRFRFEPETGRVLGVVAILVAYVAAIKPVGYVIATFVMLAVFQAAFMQRRTLKTLLLWPVGLSAVITGALYYVFAKVFLIPIP